VSCSASGQTNACGSIQTCRYTVTGLTRTTWYFAARAVDSGSQVSDYSNVASITIP